MRFKHFVQLAFNNWKAGNKVTYLLLGKPGIGKCLGKGTPVLMADGRVMPVEQIMVGDRLMGPDGKARNVLNTNMGIGKLYRVDPIKGEPWVCNDVHVLTLVNTSTSEIVDVPLDQFQNEKTKTFRARHKMFSVGVESFENDIKASPIDPYFMGAWFGDGSKSANDADLLAKVALSKPDAEIKQLCEDMAAQWELSVRTDFGSGSCPTYNLTTGSIGGGVGSNKLLRTLRDLVGVDIKVPDAILRGSAETRRQFLAGFLDTDGELACNCYSITQKREDWARAVWFIARSLGYCATITTRTASIKSTGFEGTYHVVVISGDVNQLPLRIERKKAEPREQIKVATRTGFTTTDIGEGAYYGFTLDGDGRFLLGDFTVTHNTACAWALSTMMTNHRRMSKPESPAALCEIFDLSSSLPEDLNGLPFRGQDNGTHNAPVARVMRCAAPGAYGVMCLDDLPASAPSVQVASRQAVLQRHFGETKIQDDVIMMVTGNRREDKSNASTLPAHFRNSVLMIDIDVDFEEWAEWAGEQSDMDPIVPSFLRWKPGHLATTPAEADNRGVFATPRQWAQLGRLYQVAQSLQMDLEVAQGLVGEGIGSEFAAFVKVRSQLVEPGKVLRDPKGALPNPIAVLNSPDKMIAMATGLAEVAAGWFKDKDLSAKRRKEIPLEFFRAVSHITSQGGREYVSVSVNTFTANAGPQSLAVLVNSVRDNADNEEVRPMLEFLLKAFKGGR